MIIRECSVSANDKSHITLLLLGKTCDTAKPRQIHGKKDSQATVLFS